MELYDNAMKRVRAIIQEEAKSGVVQPSLCLNHGYPTPINLLCYHGFTRSPAQFKELALRLFAKGINVWIPRLPHHGLSEERQEELGLLTPADLKSFVARHIDLVRPMGEKTVVMGISGGGVLASWAAGRYPGIQKSICISPVLGIQKIPKQFHALVPNLLKLFPQKIIKWSDEEAYNEKAYYPKFNVKSLASFLDLGVEVYKQRKLGLVSPNLTMILNGHDDKVDNNIASRIIEAWSEKHEGLIDRIDFAESENLPHDLIGIESIQENAERLYSLYEEIVCSV